jgi:hypothetical protein
MLAPRIFKMLEDRAAKIKLKKIVFTEEVTLWYNYCRNYEAPVKISTYNGYNNASRRDWVVPDQGGI